MVALLSRDRRDRSQKGEVCDTVEIISHGPTGSWELCRMLHLHCPQIKAFPWSSPCQPMLSQPWVTPHQTPSAPELTTLSSNLTQKSNRKEEKLDKPKFRITLKHNFWSTTRL